MLECKGYCVADAGTDTSKRRRSPSMPWHLPSAFSASGVASVPGYKLQELWLDRLYGGRGTRHTHTHAHP